MSFYKKYQETMLLTRSIGKNEVLDEGFAPVTYSIFSENPDEKEKSEIKAALGGWVAGTIRCIKD